MDSFKRRLAVTLISLSLGACASMSDGARDREIAWQALNVVDTGQTVSIARNPWDYHEANPALDTFTGPHPTEKSVYVTMACYAVAHAAVSYWLDSRDTGSGGWHVANLVWGYGSLAEKGLWIEHNFKNGITPWEGTSNHNFHN
jgi:hypothetical protein